MDDQPVIEKGFLERPDLKTSILDAIAQTPQHTSLFNQIAQYTYELRTSNPPYNLRITDLPDVGVVDVSLQDGDCGQPASKKRRLDTQVVGAQKQNESTPPDILHNGPSPFSVEGTSFSIPLRKKLTLELVPTVEGGLRARNPTTGTVEFAVAWRDIEQAICLSVPEKAQPSYNYCIFPRYADGVNTPPPDLHVAEPMVWTMPDTLPKSSTFGGENDRVVIKRLMDEELLRFRKRVVEPDEKEFASNIVQAHRKGEKAFHVKAFRGSKDGFLFLLPTGIVWGFKKPLTFFAFDTIDSISYTSVLQRTFNLNITTSTTDSSSETKTQDFEFSMLDQADFAGIDDYVRRHGLHDASMAEQRRAKKLNINGIKSDPSAADGQNGHQGVENGNEEGELEKAAREMEAQEDEEEGEDYDPGSEGESEGSGSSDEEDEDGDRDGEDDEDSDLIEDDPGSAVEGEVD
ncbi:MAG: hypothetical protein M1827_002961 [Pycnora praestabilis]|nr:MAG: hypothetical protein M1827_002961 [Pycnora praestabilis]